MTLLAQPRPERVLQMRQSTLPPRQLTLGAVLVTDRDACSGIPHKQIAVQIGTQTTPSMVEFALPLGVARSLFQRGLTMCDELEGGVSA